MNILHLMPCNKKFIDAFIDFVTMNFDTSEHSYFIYNHKGSDDCNNNSFYSNILLKIKNIYFADKIIIHSLVDNRLILFLFFQPWLLNKCYWVIWGGDLYGFRNEKKILKNHIRNYLFTSIVKKIGHLVTYVKGDYELAKKWYQAKGIYHECFMYPSNLYKEINLTIVQQDTINILIGHSAYESNNHLEIFRKLEKYNNNNIMIFVPLSYGSKQYAEEIIREGSKLFGTKFTAISQLMNYNQYLDFLGMIDIAIFAAKHQVAMGNTITLLGLGKKVYMRNDITPWQLFKDIDVKVFDVVNIEIDLIGKQIQKENQQKVKEYFSQENLSKQLKELFNEN